MTTHAEYVKMQTDLIADANKAFAPMQAKINAARTKLRLQLAKNNAVLKARATASIKAMNLKQKPKNPVGKTWRQFHFSGFRSAYRKFAGTDVWFASGYTMSSTWYAHDGKTVKKFLGWQHSDAEAWAARGRKAEPTELAKTRKEMAELRKELAKALKACERKAAKKPAKKAVKKAAKKAPTYFEDSDIRNRY